MGEQLLVDISGLNNSEEKTQIRTDWALSGLRRNWLYRYS